MTKKHRTPDAESSGTDADVNSVQTGAREAFSMKAYNRELKRLQLELVKLLESVKHKRQKVCVLFEGRDAAGKGGTIKRITQHLNPRFCRIVGLGKPTERERDQWYFQRYVDDSSDLLRQSALASRSLPTIVFMFCKYQVKVPRLYPGIF